jgi:2-polyprenyl-6-methoxyphenol hydroxylase-like FAD-dependent oxidoreductase
MLLGRLGYDVVLVDRAVFPADTLSTHQISRTGVVALHRWGLLPAVLDSGAPAIRQVSFTAAGQTVTRTVKDKSGVDLLVAPRRHIVDTLVAQAAAHAGVQVRLGVAIRGVHLDDSGRAVGVWGTDRDGRPVDVAARYVVGADGLNSKVARSVGAEILEDRGNHGAVEYAYFDGLPWPGIEMFAGERALAGIFPTHHGQACIWLCAPSAALSQARRGAVSRAEAFAAHLRRAAPDLADRLRSARRTSPVAGMLRTPNFRRRAHGPGWALVGDSGYHRDAVSGHGMSDAYRDAELLASALDRCLSDPDDSVSALADYQSERDRALRPTFELTLGLAAYPPVPYFVELQKQIGRAIDVEAAELAARPVPGVRALARASQKETTP